MFTRVVLPCFAVWLGVIVVSRVSGVFLCCTCFSTNDHTTSCMFLRSILLGCLLLGGKFPALSFFFFFFRFFCSGVADVPCC